MHYITRSMVGITVGKQDEAIELPIGLRAYLEKLFITALTTMDGRMHALKKQFNLKYHIPLYINHKRAFYLTHPLRDLNTVCINYYQVLSIIKDSNGKGIVVFKDLSRLKINVDFARLKQKHEKTGKILNAIKNFVSA